MIPPEKSFLLLFEIFYFSFFVSIFNFFHLKYLYLFTEGDSTLKQEHSAHERLLICSQRKPEQILQSLGVPETGLADAQAEEFRKKYGINQIPGQSEDSILLRLRRAFVNPFSIVLLLLAVLSFFTDILSVSNFSRNFTTVYIILSMLLISGIIRFVQELHSKRVADRLTRLVHTTVQVRRNGSWQERPAEELVVGDIVRLDAGDRVPADIRLTEAIDFFVTQSTITGESDVTEKKAAVLPAVPQTMQDYANTVFLGSSVVGGYGRGIVLAVGADTIYGGFSPENAARKNGFSKGENSIAWVLIKFMAVLVPIVFLAYGLTKGNWLEAFLFSLSVTVGLTPELLPMVITACLAKGSSKMGQKQTIVKNINAMESFGSMDILCVDKTGTLTGDRIFLEYYMDILGNENTEVLDYAFLNSAFHTGVANHLDRAILQVRNMPGHEEHFAHLLRHCRKIDEIPFDYTRKFASTLIQTEGHGCPLIVIKGNLDEVVARCTSVSYRGELHRIDPGDFSSVHAVVDEMLEDGMKVLAVAVKPLNRNTLTPADESELTLLGYLCFFDAPKQSAASAIRKLLDLHIHVKILTGDHLDIATSVCRRLGIAADHTLTGAQLDALSDNDLQIRMERTTIFADLSPQQKVYIIDTLQGNGHSVGFLGDGMNDLPAEMQADVGISVDTATDAVKESADVILMKKDLNVLSEGVLEGRKAFANMSKYIKITASSNFGNICAIVIASVLLPFFPMTSVQLLLLNLLYDILCLVLPWDHVDPDLSARPLEWSGSTLARFMGYFGPISSIFDLLTFGFLFFWLCPSVCGGSYRNLAAEGQALFVSMFQTGWFLESLWTQVMILHLLRTRELSFFHSNASRSVCLITFLGILVFTVLTFSPLGTMVGLTAMPAQYFCFLTADVIFYLLLVTLMKKLYIIKYDSLI